MAVTIGELVGITRIDDSGADQGLNRVRDRMRRFGDETDSALGNAANRAGQQGRNAGDQFGNGLGDGASQGAAGASDQVQGHMSTLGPKLAAAGAAAGALAGAGLALAFTNALSVEEANAKFRIQLGGNQQYAKEMGEVSGALFSKGYADNLGEINDAVRAVVQSGALMEDATNEQIESMTAKAMTLGKTYEQDVGMVAIAAGAMVRNGLADADQAMDLLARGLSQAGPLGDDLLETFQEYSPLFKSLGLDGADAMGLIQQAAAGGARNLDQAADAIKEFGIRAIDGSKAAAEGYKALGLNAEEMTAKIAKGGPAAKEGFAQVLTALKTVEDPVAQNAAAVGLFGTKWEDMRDAMLSMDVSSAAASLGDVAGKAQEAAEIMENTATQKVQGLENGFKQWTASMVSTEGPLGTVAAGLMAFGPGALTIVSQLAMVGMAFGGLLAKAVPAMLSLIAQGATWVATTVAQLATIAVQWTIAAAQYVAKLAMMVASGAVQVGLLIGQLVMWAAGIVAQGAIALASMVATAAAYVAQWVIMAAGAMARAAIMAASWLIAMGPIGWVIAAVVGLVALIIANWDTVKEWTAAAWEAVSSAISAAWDFICSLVQGAVEIVKGILNWFSELPGLISDWFGQAKDWAVQKLTELISWLGGLPGKILSALASLGTLLVDAGKNLISGLWDGIMSMGSWLMDKVLGFIKSFVPGPILSFLGIASPSKLFRDEIGKWIPEGLAVGIERNADVAGQAARALAADTLDSASAGLTGANGLALAPGSLSGAVRGGDGASSGGITNNVNVYNPTAERASDSVSRELRTVGILGGFSDDD